MTLTELRAKKIEELRSLLALVQDDSALLKLEAREKEALQTLADVRSEIARYRQAMGMSPAGQPTPAPAQGDEKQRRHRVDKGELREKLLMTLRHAPSEGYSVKELAEKLGVSYATFNTFRNNEKDLGNLIYAERVGTSVMLRLKESAATVAPKTKK